MTRKWTSKSFTQNPMISYRIQVIKMRISISEHPSLFSSSSWLTSSTSSKTSSLPQRRHRLRQRHRQRHRRRRLLQQQHPRLQRPLQQQHPRRRLLKQQHPRRQRLLQQQHPQLPQRQLQRLTRPLQVPRNQQPYPLNSQPNHPLNQQLTRPLRFLPRNQRPYFLNSLLSLLHNQLKKHQPRGLQRQYLHNQPRNRLTLRRPCHPTRNRRKLTTSLLLSPRGLIRLRTKEQPWNPITLAHLRNLCPPCLPRTNHLTSRSAMNQSNVQMTIQLSHPRMVPLYLPITRPPNIRSPKQPCTPMTIRPRSPVNLANPTNPNLTCLPKNQAKRLATNLWNVPKTIQPNLLMNPPQNTQSLKPPCTPMIMKPLNLTNIAITKNHILPCLPKMNQLSVPRTIQRSLLEMISLSLLIIHPQNIPSLNRPFILRMKQPCTPTNRTGPMKTTLLSLSFHHQVNHWNLIRSSMNPKLILHELFWVQKYLIHHVWRKYFTFFNYMSHLPNEQTDFRELGEIEKIDSHLAFFSNFVCCESLLPI